MVSAWPSGVIANGRLSPSRRMASSDKGIGVLIKIAHTADVRGKPLPQ
jgi:hypothetical protein